MIASILGCGIGRNLQFCNNVLIGEREWNKSIETQFEDRFHRFGTENKVIIDYCMAAQTIDEMSDEMVKLKGQISGSVLEKNWNIDNDLLVELAEMVVAKRLKYVG